jgi:phospholipase C
LLLSLDVNDEIWGAVMKLRTAIAAGVCLAVVSVAAIFEEAAPAGSAVGKIDHLVVIYEENHSFDNLWGGWPGANGLAGPGASTHATQVDQTATRTPFPCLLQDDVNLATPPLPGACSGTKADGSTFHSAFANRPFDIGSFIPAGGPKAQTCYVPTPAAPSGPANGVVAGPAAAPGGCTRDLVHRYYQEQYQIDGGRQDRYVSGSDADGLAMGHYDTTQLPLYQYLHGAGAPSYVIDDSFFQAAFGGSFLNHQFLISAGAPLWPGGADTSGSQAGCATGTANCDLHSVVDANGMPKGSDLYKPTATAGAVTGNPTVADNPLTQAGTDPTGTACAVRPGAGTPPRGTSCGDYAVNTIQPFSQPYQPGTPVGKRLPLLTTPTIGDELSARGVSWAWYAGGWDNAAGITNGPGWTNGPGPKCRQQTFSNATFPYCPDLEFQFHHQPFNYYAAYRSIPNAQGQETNQARLDHLKDEADFVAAAKAGTLPAVSFVKPIGPENEHPGYTGVHEGEEHLVDLIQAIQASPDWKSTAIVVTYDEFGGSWDHVPPPTGKGVSDRWGPGTRIPAMVISPLLAKPAAVDHTAHDTTSILATIEHRWQLAPLGTRDAAVADLASSFGHNVAVIPAGREPTGMTSGR